MKSMKIGSATYPVVAGTHMALPQYLAGKYAPYQVDCCSLSEFEVVVSQNSKRTAGQAANKNTEAFIVTDRLNGNTVIQKV
jgi:hypothetical protein